MCVSSLSNVYISPTSGIRAHGGVGQKVARLLRFHLQLERARGVCTWLPFANGVGTSHFLIWSGDDILHKASP